MHHVSEDAAIARARDEIAYLDSRLSGLGLWYSLLLGAIGGTVAVTCSLLFGAMLASDQPEFVSDAKAIMGATTRILEVLAEAGGLAVVGIAVRAVRHYRATMPQWAIVRGLKDEVPKSSKFSKAYQSAISGAIGDLSLVMDLLLKVLSTAVLLFTWYKVGLALTKLLAT